MSTKTCDSHLTCDSAAEERGRLQLPVRSNNLRINMKKQVDELRIRDVLFDRAVDNDDELNITIEGRGAYEEDIDIWINKDEARKIVTHLKMVFGV